MKYLIIVFILLTTQAHAKPPEAVDLTGTPETSVSRETDDQLCIHGAQLANSGGYAITGEQVANCVRTLTPQRRAEVEKLIAAYEESGNSILEKLLAFHNARHGGYDTGPGSYAYGQQIQQQQQLNQMQFEMRMNEQNRQQQQFMANGG